MKSLEKPVFDPRFNPIQLNAPRSSKSCNKLFRLLCEKERFNKKSNRCHPTKRLLELESNQEQF